jgi:hypothetical protein
MGKEIQNTNQTITNSFIKGLNKDSDPSYVQEGMWTHARNISNNTFEGDLGTLSNESSNYLCLTTGATMPTAVTEIKIIGAIQLFSDKWIIFTAGHNVNGRPVMSEIGLFEEERCIYRPIVQDACLAFDKRYLISGASREKEDCTWQVYWADGLNPDRYLNVGDPQTWPTPDYNWIGGGLSTMNYYSNGVDTTFLWPGVEWFEICTDTTTGCTQVSPGVWSPDCPPSINACISCKPINTLNCDKIRLARLMETPCLNLTLGQSGGTLRNGTYFALIAYSIKGQKVTDYFSQSNNQPVWHPDDFQGSLTLEVSADSENFDEFILVIVQNINQGTVARQIGIYSSRTTVIALDQIKEDLVSVPLQFLPIQTPVFEKCDQIAEVNNYLLRVGPTSKFDFNYQPLANLIKAKWASVQYPSNYYVQGGNKGSYLRDEVYAFFIRWVYDTGDKSASYHIPGRAPLPGETAGSTDINALATDDRYFEVFDTAIQDSSITVFPNSTFNPTLGKYVLPDGGVILKTGDMAYWESTEKYPDDRPDIYNASYNCWTGETIPSPVYDLCGQPIRHHKFPNNCLTNDTIHFSPNTSNNGDNILNIRLMGVYFENIIFPKDNEGNDIPGIVGYEILRGSREGNKSIIAKGMLNNFRTYNLTGNARANPNPATLTKGLYANYPFNTIRPFYNTNNPSNHNYQFNDPYFRIPVPNDATGNNVDDQQVPLDMMSFHSPDTMFRSPLLTTTELKVYGYLRGRTSQQFIEPNKHPQFKLLADAILFPVFLAGLIEGIISLLGKRTYNLPEMLPASGVSDAFGAVPAAYATALGILQPGLISYNTFLDTYFASGVALADAGLSIIGSPTAAAGAETALITILNTSAIAQVNAPIVQTGTIEFPRYSYLPTPLRVLGATNQLLYYFSEGADVAQKLILAVTPYRQYALQMISHGFYNNMIGNATSDTFRFKLDDSFYIRDNFQQVPYYQNDFGTGFNYTINNLKRSDTVVLRTKSGPYLNPAFPNGLNIGPKYITDNFGRFIDQSLTTLGTIQQYGLIDPSSLFITPVNNIDAPDFENTDIPFSLPIASHYAAIKVRLRNQYGQLPSVKQVVITPCEQKLSDYPNYINNAITSIVCDLPNQLRLNSVRRTPLFFGGDTYINRYTEKNTMFMFYDWLFGQPDGFEYNYYLRKMIPNPRFWVNSAQYDISNLAPSNFSNPTPGTGALPTRFYRLDFDNYDYTSDPNQVNYPGLFSAKESKFYLAVSSVRDFYVESDVLVDFRDMGDYEWDKNYDANRYTDLVSMFNIDPENITKGNTYRYDYSLSISKLYNQYFSQGNLQSRYYDPEIAKLCYTYYPDRIYYSLQQQDESFKDSWFVYLANNYREFKSQISGVKSINKSGLFITFRNDSPQMFQGVDSQPLDAKLLTPEGWVTMENITTEHKVIGRDGKTYNVLNVYEIGLKPIYRVHFKDGSSVRASDTHKWNVLDYKARAKNSSTYLKEKIKSTTELSFDYHRRDALPLPSGIEFSEKEYIIPPYTLGALIADGCITTTPFISCVDYKIIEKIKNESNTLSKIKTGINKNKNTFYTVSLIAKSARRENCNPYKEELKKLNLFGKKGLDKYIPSEYMFGSFNQRLQLLKGLMDCDGTASTGKISYSTISKKLAENVKDLVLSLGGVATIKEYKKLNYTKKEIVEYRVRFQCNFNPFYLKRKSDKVMIRLKEPYRYIVSVEYEGVEEARCIKTDAPDELYITDNYVLTHNTLQTDLGTKITIGDGGLFSQPGQSVSNADKAYEYGSSQNRLSIANTPAGLFYVSQNQSKILGYGEGLKEISQIGLKWWFSLFLRYKLTDHFPNYPWQDNPVAGIGIQSVYDNLNSVLYFAKKDYDLRPEYINPETGTSLVEYIPLVTVGKTRVYETTLRKGEGDFFVIKNPDGSVNMNNRYRLEENLLFKNASWTVSYDPKNEFWISFHDWHPDLVIPTKRTFLTTKNNTGWTHNYSCNEFCNYYGIDYPFEIEIPIITGQTVTTVKSIEYILECYKRSDNCVDQFQVLDFNFDKAVVFNSEQVSGYLNFNIFPKNNITLSLQYPKPNNSIIIEPTLPASVGFDILFSKEENKYRFNQFWDITKDRGEFPIGSTYPPVGPLIPGTTQLLGNYNQEYLWNTEPNGYVKILNPNNLDVNKSLLQRKKFRHYLNLLHLRKDVSGNVNMLIKLINSKNQISLR